MILVGIALGAGVGAALGKSAIGVALGVALGAGLEATARRQTEKGNPGKNAQEANDKPTQMDDE